MKTLARRDFLKMAGISGVAAVTAGASLASGTKPTEQGEMTDMPGAGAGGMSYQEMDLHHQEGVDKFLANIGSQPTFWNNPLAYEMDGDVKVFNLVSQEIDWEVEAGIFAKAMAYNGVVPGPEIRVTLGDKVRIILKNEMTQSTAIHFHGLIVPNAVDGVPMITQAPVIPGDTFVYEFEVKNTGTHMYHSHHNSAEQNTRGLLGAFIVEPADKTNEPVVTGDYNLVLNDSGLGTYTINGKSFPFTQPMIAKFGDKIRIRYFNEGLMIHPMHLHGIPQQVIAKDGFNLPMPYMCDTLNIAPGERYDVIVDCTELGIWAFHCHVLSHAEGPNGMFGMVTVLIVQE